MFIVQKSLKIIAQLIIMTFAHFLTIGSSTRSLVANQVSVLPAISNVLYFRTKQTFIFSIVCIARTTCQSDIQRQAVNRQPSFCRKHSQSLSSRCIPQLIFYASQLFHFQQNPFPFPENSSQLYGLFDTIDHRLLLLRIFNASFEKNITSTFCSFHIFRKNDF